MAKGESGKPLVRPKPTGRKAPAKNEKPQSERFEEIARKLEVDETGETFHRAFSAMVPPRKADA